MAFASDSGLPVGSSLLPFPIAAKTFSLQETGSLQVVSSDFFIVGGGLVTVESDVSAVPLPGALPLFSGRIALLGYLSRRRRKPMAEPAA